MRTLFSFIKWVCASLFKKLALANDDLREALEYNTGEALGLWFVATVLLSIVNLIVVGLIAVIAGTRPSSAFVLWLPLTMFVHLVYTAFSVMFKCFKQERAELFETIKNGK